MNTQRIEAFSDGVIASIITIMILELRPPHEADAAALLARVPTLLTYVLSFLVVAIMWVNHHHVLHTAKQVTARLLWSNNLLLFCMSLIPFVTAYMGETHGAPLATAVYGAVLSLCSLSFIVLRAALRAQHDPHPSLLAQDEQTQRKNLLALSLYIASVPLAFVWPPLSQAIFIVIALAYFLPERPVAEATTRLLPLIAVLGCLLTPNTVRSEVAPLDSALFSGLRWRCIGPFRGGRTVAATGVPGQPHLFYMGVSNGGVWKTDDAGRVWTPIFDEQSTNSIGAIAVATSDPRVIYVGSGEGLQRPDLSIGNGIYRSDDAGRTWKHLGLRDGQQIPDVAVDPRDPRRVFAAVLGHPYGPNPERGVYRSTDAGEHWEKVLGPNDDTGAMQVVFDPANPATMFAVLWSARQAPWEVGSSFTLSGNNGLWKSTDGGTTWRSLTNGLPGATDALGRIGIALAPSAPKRMYAVLGAAARSGLYASDDAGEHWRRVNGDHRLCDRDGDFNEVRVDPRNPDIVYVANVVTWKSIDGGRNFAAWRGAPGGDDYHRLWISPDDPRTILLAGDQGAVVTLNDGATWSSWYNQPTAQFYHVATDDHFPYRVYGGQQESGSAGVLSRGNDGQITFREWHPVGAEEYGYVAPDPLHPNIVFGGKVERFDWATGDAQNVSPDPLRGGEFRWVRTMPLVFSHVDPRVLYLGSNVVFRTSDGGSSWRTMSPDLARANDDVPPNLGAFARLDPEKGRHRGVVYSLAPGFHGPGLLWAGTDDGRIHVTHDDGRRWLDVTPPHLPAWSKIAQIEASPFDTLTAYAALNTLRLDDASPHALRTRDGGRTWTAIVAGIDSDAVVNAVREDPKRRGLLYAGTERGVFVSFDDGDHWQSLQLNLPRTSVRDLVVHDDDLVVATHGRSFWILDDLAPVREATQTAVANTAYLCRPAGAVRVRWNRNTDTPLPPDEPAARNPPDGVALDYWLPRDAGGPVRLEILNSSGRPLRRFSSDDEMAPPDSTLNIPGYWVRPPWKLSARAGGHRVIWDLHESPLPIPARRYPIAAIEHDTAPEPAGAWVLPGTYRVRLTVGGVVKLQPLTVRMDPRIQTSAADLLRQHALSLRLVAQLETAQALDTRIAAAGGRIRGAVGAGRLSVAGSDSLLRELTELTSGATPRDSAAERRGPESLRNLNGSVLQLYELLQDSDRPPTRTAEGTVARLEAGMRILGERVASLERRMAAVGAGSG